MKQISQWRMLASLTPTMIYLFYLGWGCARIDNNRREYWKESCERWCTCVCAPHFFSLRFFIRFSCEILMTPFKKQIPIADYSTMLWYLFLCFSIVREQTTTDVNIEQRKLRKMVYMRVCSAFFFMCCTTVQVIKILLTTQKQKHYSDVY